MNKKVPAGTIRTGARLPDKGRVILRWFDPPLKFDRHVHVFTTHGKIHRFPITSMVEVTR